MSRNNGNGFRIYVGNLPFTVTEKRLRDHFETYGVVTSCFIPTDRETGRSRGFGFVEFEQAEYGWAAIDATNNKELDGRKLKVNPAQPRS